MLHVADERLATLHGEVREQAVFTRQSPELQTSLRLLSSFLYLFSTFPPDPFSEESRSTERNCWKNLKAKTADRAASRRDGLTDTTVRT